MVGSSRHPSGSNPKRSSTVRSNCFCLEISKHRHRKFWDLCDSLFVSFPGAVEAYSRRLGWLVVSGFREIRWG